MSQSLNSPVARKLDRRLAIILLWTVFLVAIFWAGSRYPQLNEKAMMGADTPIAGLAFDILIDVLPDSSFAYMLFANTINWVYTNWKGMTFGVLFGACLMTALGLIQRRSFNNSFADAALGATIGTPLGVCVNCAAPIAQGLHSVGARLETTLAALIASPTLNIIVVSMSFALLPTYMAAIKLVATLAFILVGIPLLCRYVFKSERAATVEPRLEKLTVEKTQRFSQRLFQKIQPNINFLSGNESVLSAIFWVISAYLKNLVFIVVITVPLMFVAGLLGALVVTLLPFSTLVSTLSGLQGGLMTVVGVVMITAVALFVPVPIAFDVILASILLTAGLPAKFTIPLLIGLGSFSVYSFLVIGRAISFRVSSVVTVGLAIIAIGGGVIGWQIERTTAEQSYRAALNVVKAVPDFQYREDGRKAPQSSKQIADLIKPHVVNQQPMVVDVSHDGQGQVSVTTSNAKPVIPTEKASPKMFATLAGADIGLDQDDNLAGPSNFEPFNFFWAITAGDIHGDGWDDLVMANDSALGGVSLYANIAGRFERQAIDLGDVNRSFVNAAALVDLNNDGRLDLFVSTHLTGAFIYWNNDGTFDAQQRVKLPNQDAVMVGAPAFADLDKDGDLDIVAANWSVGTHARWMNPHFKRSRDRILWNENGSFVGQELPGLPGESMTSLIMDVDKNGHPDIIIGDDIAPSDKVYLNKGGRKFDLLTKKSGRVPYLIQTTMSFDSGDFDNDLDVDIYGGQIARPENPQRPSRSALARRYCEAVYSDKSERVVCLATDRDRLRSVNSRQLRTNQCSEITDETKKARCALNLITTMEQTKEYAHDCDTYLTGWPRLNAICNMVREERLDGKAVLAEGDYPGSVRRRNIFLRNGAGVFEDVASDLNVASPGWTWNAKFNDLDQDGFLDMFVAIGELFRHSLNPNVFYKNDGGKGFIKNPAGAGLDDITPATAYVSVDYDRDGDMDIIRAAGVVGPIVHRNDRPEGGALWVQLYDETGNRYGIGARVTITTASGQQIRDAKASGGYISFDPPKVHFGLGQDTQARTISVTWPDGATSFLRGAFPANSTAMIKRQK